MKQPRTPQVVYIEDEEAHAIRAAIVERQQEKNLVATRGRRKNESRRRRIEARRDQTTASFPLEIEGVYTEDVGEVRLRVEALANSLVILKQRQDPATLAIPEDLKPGQKIRLARAYRATQLPHAQRIADALPALMQEWFSGLFEEWNRDTVLFCLEHWSRGRAAKALTLRTVQGHITKIRTGRRPADQAARNRLARALAKIARTTGNRGRRAKEKAVSRQVVPMYRKLLPEIQRVRKDYPSDSSEARHALNKVLATSFPIPPDAAQRSKHLLFSGKQKPSRVTAGLVAACFDETCRRVEAAVRLSRTQK